MTTSTARWLTAAAIAMVAVALTGCRSNRAAVGTTPSTKAETTKPAASASTVPKAEREACRTILAGYNDQWQRMKSPVTLRLKSPQSVSISGNIFFDRGRSIVISLRFLGFEVAVINVTSDSLLAVDKYNKRYVSEPLKPLIGNFPIDIANVQNMLMGRPFLLGSTKPIAYDADRFDFDASTESPIVTMIPKSMPGSVSYGFTFDTALASLLGLIVKAGERQPVVATYGKAVDTRFGPVSKSVTIEAKTSDKDIVASVELNPEKIKWDSDVDLRKPERPGKNYERIPASKLLKMFSGF